MEIARPNMPLRTRIAVIGAGVCGLASVRALREEGLEPVCFERTGRYGGLWNYHDDVIDGVASVAKTTVCNTSKELGAASNFPPPKEFPNYLPHKLMFEYITLIAKEFDVLKHVKYHQEVVAVVPSSDYQSTGRWVVSTKDIRTGITSSEEFHGVMVCIGHHVNPNVPTFPGIKTFQGKVLHTHSLKSNEGFEDERVVVVGVGSSGVDAATDISNVAKQVYLSCRKGSWVFPRVGPNGRPIDVCFIRRYFHQLQKILPDNVTCWYLERVSNQRFNHSTYNIKPQHRVWNQHPTVSDMLPLKMITGAVVARRGIKAFVHNGVIFEGEEEVTEVDTVILATGYRIKFPFLHQDIISVEDNRVKLYMNMYPPDLPHPSLVIMGLIQPSGSGFAPGEMQCRWASRVMSGKCFLPSPMVMWKDIKRKEEANRKRYVDSPRHTIEVDYISYTDELAKFIGAKPNFWKMAFKDPRLFWACVTGPSLPYQYRLQGPNRWDGAREAILSYKERELAPYRGSEKKKSVGIWRKLICT